MIEEAKKNIEKYIEAAQKMEVGQNNENTLQLASLVQKEVHFIESQKRLDIKENKATHAAS